MKGFKKISIVDIVNFLFWFIILVFYIITFSESEFKLHGFLLLAGLAVFSLAVIYFRSFKHKNWLLKLVILLYPVVFLVMIFDSLHMVLPYINSEIFDKMLADIDFAILGANPTVWIEPIINPPLTEFMYYLYLFYFPMPLIILGYLFKNKMFLELDKSMVFYFLTYYGAYLMYFAVPALGPRFYEPLVTLQKVPLEGLYLTDIIRDTISSLEHNKFDAFPSLHAAISLTTIIVIGKYRKKWLYFFIPILIGIFISLIYCRYHYFIDIVAGVAWTLISYWIVEKCYDKLFAKGFVPFYS